MTFVWLQKLVYKRVVRILLPAKQRIALSTSLRCRGGGPKQDNVGVSAGRSGDEVHCLTGSKTASWASSSTNTTSSRERCGRAGLAGGKESNDRKKEKRQRRQLYPDSSSLASWT